MDDAQLIRRYVEDGSEAAFSELVQRHLSLVHSAALRQVGGDFHRAKDVTQIVFTVLARKAASLTRHTSLTGWLYAATHFAATTEMRGERRRKMRDEETYQMNELLANAEPEMDWNRLRPVLDGVMFELNEHDRDAILWRFFDALPFAILGEKFGISENAAKKRVDRALDKMRASLARRGATSTTAALAMMLANHAMAAAPVGLAETVTASALAAAAGAGAPASGVFKFLGKAKLAAGVSGAMWIGGILAIPAIGAAAYELWSAWHAHVALSQGNADYEADQARLQALQQVARNARPAAAAMVKTESGARDPKTNFRNFLALFPQARAMAIGDEKQLVDHVYGSFFRSAGLTPFQIKQFENIVAENWIRNMGMAGGDLILDETPLPPAGQMRALLGEQAYREFQDYAPTVGARYWANAVAANSVAVSFSAGQLDQLAQILIAASPTGLANFKDESLASLDWDAVMAQTKTLFPDSQWKSVKTALLLFQLRSALAQAGRSP